MNDTALIDEARVNLGIAKANLNLGKWNLILKLLLDGFCKIVMKNMDSLLQWKEKRNLAKADWICKSWDKHMNLILNFW